MTAMPQLVALFHALVGLAAVTMVASAPSTPAQAFGIGVPGAIELARASSRCRSAPPSGRVTFTGSVIAFAKLDGNMSGKPIMLPGRHAINIASVLPCWC